MHCKLAKHFEQLVRADERFEITNLVKRGLVCFRLLGPDEWTRKLLDQINSEGKLHMIPSVVQNKYCIRYAITNGQKNTEIIGKNKVANRKVSLSFYRLRLDGDSRHSNKNPTRGKNRQKTGNFGTVHVRGRPA